MIEEVVLLPYVLVHTIPFHLLLHYNVSQQWWFFHRSNQPGVVTTNSDDAFFSAAESSAGVLATTCPHRCSRCLGHT